MTAPQLHIVPDEGLGNTAYLLDVGDGQALAVDPSLDLRAVKAAAQRAGLRISWAADTHLHADFLSGSLDLARSDGAKVFASAAGRRNHPHTGLADGDEVDLGSVTLRALGTPGHTDEHVAFEVLDGSRTLGIFTGGSLTVGAAARTDLVDPARAEEFARAQYRSLQTLAAFDDDVAIWPTHGGGSFCSVQVPGPPVTTVGAERATNALLAAADEDSFVRALLDSLGTHPPYFHRLGEANRRGPAPARSPHLPLLDPAQVREALNAGVVLVDVRPVSDFSQGHVPGSVSIPLRPVFASWLGWLIDFDASVVVVRNPNQDPEEVWWQAQKIGFGGLRGEVADGLAGWRAQRRPLSTIPLLAPTDVSERTVIDIRQHVEFTGGHLPGAQHVELGALAAGLAGSRGPAHEAAPNVAVDAIVRSVDESLEPAVVMCGHGERAMSGASLLARAGHTNLTVLDGGPDTWAEATGNALSVPSNLVNGPTDLHARTAQEVPQP